MNHKYLIVLITIISSILVNALYSQEISQEQLLDEGLKFYQKMDYQNAALKFIKAIEVNNGNTDSFIYIINLYKEIENTKAMQYYINLGRKYHPNFEYFYYYEALKYQIENKIELAIEKIKEGINLSPANSDMYLLLYNLYIQIEDYENAYKVLDELLILFPADNKIKNLQVSFAQQTGDYITATKFYTYKIANDPNNANNYLQAGYNEYLQGHYKLAFAYYDKAKSISKNYKLLADEYKSLIYVKLGKYDLALKIYLNSLASYKTEKEIYTKTASIFYARKEYVKSLSLYNRLTKLENVSDLISKKFYLLENIAYCYLMIRDYEKALYYFDFAINRGHKQVNLFINAGWCSQRLGKYKKANDYYKMVVDEYKYNSTLLCNYALTNAYLANYEESELVLKKLINHKDKDYVYLYLAVICYLQDDYDKSLSWIKKALDLDSKIKIDMIEDLMNEEAFKEMFSDIRFQNLIYEYYTKK